MARRQQQQAVPITFIDRQLGVSKMNKGIIKEGVIGVLKLKWLSMFKNYRRRVKSNNTVSMDEYVSVQRK